MEVWTFPDTVNGVLDMNALFFEFFVQHIQYTCISNKGY